MYASFAIEGSRKMSQSSRSLRAIPQATLRRLRNTPTYFVLIWRWMAWIYALLWYITNGKPLNYYLLPLAITLLMALVGTLYAPVFQVLMPRLPSFNKLSLPGWRKQQAQRQHRRVKWSFRRAQPLSQDEEPELMTIVRTQNTYGDILIYGLDVVFCGLIVYFTAPIWGPPFGDGSPFYRYGLSAILAASFAYRYRGALASTVVYEAIVLAGAFFPLPGTQPFTVSPSDIIASTIDAPLVGIIAAYLASLLESYTRSKRREQDNVRKQQALLHVSETLIETASDRQSFLQRSAEQIRKGGHFGRLLIALVDPEDEEKSAPSIIDTTIEVGLDEVESFLASETLLEQVEHTGEKLSTFESIKGEGPDESYRLARLYMPLFKEGKVHVVLGAESVRQTPFDKRQEEFLTIVGAQLVVALENIHLREQAAELAAIAERGRIAREMHDGVAQLVYMLSLNTETCAALAHRLADTSTAEGETLTPLAERLDRLVTLSKQALWETRHYMFSLKPLISGTTTLTQMLKNQIHEFETISGLPVQLTIEGSETLQNGDRRRNRQVAQVGTAIFRSTQEALTNAYKHADATQIQVYLRHQPRAVEVEICDNGKGLHALPHSYDLSADGERQRIYSGHGMGGMRERAEELGGTFEIAQAASGGVSIRACIPT